MSLSWDLMRPLALTYALLPVAVFLLGWLRASFAIAATLILLLVWLWSSSVRVRRACPLWSPSVELLDAMNPASRTGEEKGSHAIQVSRAALLLLALVASLWVFFSGIGGFWAQSTDFTARNGIFRCLVLDSWPVYFDGGASSLVYYLNHWLPAAALGKIGHLLSGDADLSMRIANIALYVWSVAGVFLVELLALLVLRVSSNRDCLIAVLVLVFFSGCDVAGIILRCLMGSSEVAAHAFGTMHLEQWAGSSYVQYSSNTTLLHWVFNQTIIPWVCTLSVLLERDHSRYVPFALACFGAGPYPFVGLVALCLVLGISSCVRSIRGGNALLWLRSVSSPANLCAALLAVIYLFFFLGNHSVASSGDRLQPFGLAPGATLRLIVLFYIVEIGVYLVPLFSRYKKNPLYWFSAMLLAILPFIHLGSWYEVCFRVSIPVLLVICLMSARLIIEAAPSLLVRPVAETAMPWLLVIVLSIGAVTPLFEFARGAVAVSRFGVEGAVQPAADIGSAHVQEGAQSNFKAPVSDGGVFFTYLAQPYEEEQDDG